MAVLTTAVTVTTVKAEVVVCKLDTLQLPVRSLVVTRYTLPSPTHYQRLYLMLSMRRRREQV